MSNADRLPPQNIEAEMGVIGSMMLDGEVADDALGILDASDFYRESHGLIAQAIFDLRSEGSPVDSITVEERLRLADQIGKAGGLDYLLSCLNATPHAANGRYYAQIVKEKSIARALISASLETLDECYENASTAEHLKQAAERRFFAISDGRARFEGVTAGEATARYMARIDRMRETDEAPGFRSGLACLDSIIGGVEGGQVIVVGARPRTGKTSFALQWADHVAVAHGKASLFASLEMSEQELAMRLLSLRTGIDNRKLQFPKLLNRVDLADLESAQADIAARTASCPVVFDDSASLTVPLIAAHARRIKSRHGLGMIVIDYLQRVKGDNPREPRHEQVAQISRDVKTLARELDVPILELVQLNREPEKRDDGRPRMSDLRESGQIEQDAHFVVLLHRPELHDREALPGLAEIIVDKNRNGPPGFAKARFVGRLTKFEDFEPEPDGPGDDGDSPY